MPDKPAIHQSTLAMLYKCPKQYEFRYIQGLIRLPGVAMVTGTGVHRAVEADLSHKIEAGELLPDEAVADMARDAVVAEWERGVEVNEAKEGTPDEAKAGAIDRAVSLASLHHGVLAPSLEPISVERRWKLDLEGYPYDLAGTIDIEEPHALRDTKTAAKSPAKTAADDSLQLTAYAVAIKYCNGALPSRLCLDHLVSLKTPKIVTLETTRTERHVELFLRRLEVAMRQLEAGVFPPTDPSNWWCGPRWCGFFKECPYV